MKTKTISGIKVKATVKAGGINALTNHNRARLRIGGGIKVKATVKAGGINALTNHNRGGLKVRVGIKAGEILQANHSRRASRAR